MKGIVVDSARLKPIAYVNVYVKRGNSGTTTDTKGNFTISARPTDTIRFFICWI
ncbi:MAG: carboxypeptidase-like regulatory domain-containing protein [Bacteroidota bacterium]